MDRTALLADLRAVVGDGNVLVDRDAAAFTDDPRGVVGVLPVAVVRPGSTEEVAAVVRACAGAGVGVVAQGGHTGMSGAAQVYDDTDAVVVSLRRLDRIERVDAADGTATVGAGVTIEALQAAADHVDLRFAPDWGARGSATIGGGVATNAGGTNVVQHGPMRDHVLGLEVVLADGRVWDGLRSLHKDATGYRLRDLFIGSEGTLGIVTRVVVRLVPKPHEERSAFVSLRDLDAAAELLAWLRGSGATVAAFELLPEAGVAGVVERFGRQRPLDPTSEWSALFRLAGPRGTDVGELIGDLLEGAFAAGLVAGAAIAATAEQEANLWAIRDEVSPSLLMPEAADGSKFDTAVPIGRVVEFVRRASAIVEEVGGRGWRPYAFGHVGDGNIHFYALAPDSPSGGDDTTRLSIESAIDALIVELGGTLSAEHGIGRLLLDRIRRQKPDLELELAWRIKHALDPEGVFNPGTALAPPAAEAGAGA